MATVTLPPLISRDEIHERLAAIFPPGTPQRAYTTRQLAASTVFTALYINAIEGSGTFLGPKHIYRMTDEQARSTEDTDRERYATEVLKAGHLVPGKRWYQDNTREPIRDETLRDGLVRLGAVVERPGIATTSSRPRYALTRRFAALFDPTLQSDALGVAIESWRGEALNPGALARIAIVRRGAAIADDHILVSFPNGETQRLKPGPSSIITKAVIEEFALAFLTKPVVLFVSESGNKVVARHDELARAVGLQIQADRNLPDIILADLGPAHPLLVFVEVVATDGPVNVRRKEALDQVALDGGFPPEHVAHVTAYLDRSAASFRKTIDSLAWGTYAWFASEPDRLIDLREAPGPLR